MNLSVKLTDIDRYIETQAARVTIDEAKPFFRRGGGASAFLILHGWSASAESTRFIADGLAKEGYSVLAPTLPGHGSTAEDMGNVGPVEWFKAAHQAAELLFGAYGRLHILGISMGGALAIQLAACAPDLVRSLTTVNAPVAMRSASFAGDIVGPSSDRYLEGWSRAEFFGPAVPEITYQQRLKKSGADLYAMCGLARDLLSEIHCPALVFQSIRDKVVPSSNAEEILDRINSVTKRAVYLDKSFHVSQLDVDRDTVIAEVAAFAAAIDVQHTADLKPHHTSVAKNAM
ncbi:alpha/beta fold hydrolase [Rhizobium sp. NZLR3b]|uniref:alpha/beta hydrolase n=1 Tax=Rhizobium sp. NZLR3b TaxID=2731101 RepID=UPI001C833E06|nr:alpha/beta fold hydrolase [Rhizobium sp. NZLR3b]MBX5193552.1 alpha/beta fold hydrolase [Rhizobium sp. NZLR3b]